MWHFWDGPGDLATWVTTLAVGGVAWELAAGARRRARDQASQIQIYAAENRVVGGVFINGDRLDHFTHEVHLRNGSAQPIYFPHVVLSTTSRFRWPWLRRRKVSRGPLVPYDQREGVVASGQEADRLCNIENGCYVVFRDSNGKDWCRDVLSQRLLKVRPWTGVVRFDKRLLAVQVFLDPRQVEASWKMKHQPEAQSD